MAFAARWREETKFLPKNYREPKKSYFCFISR